MASGNVITNNGRNVALERLFDAESATVNSKVSEWQSGTGTTTPANTDTALESAIGAKDTFTTGYPVYDTSSQKVAIRGFMDSATNNGNTISEAATFDTNSSPTIFSHEVFTGIAKSAAVEIVFAWSFRIMD